MTHCTYPNCNCPFDAPADPNWCARGLPKAEASAGCGERVMTIAEKYAQQYQPNGEVSLADLIQAAVDEAQSVPANPDYSVTQLQRLKSLMGRLGLATDESLEAFCLDVDRQLSRAITATETTLDALLSQQSVPVMGEPVALDEIRGAVARGWCAHANAEKTMDTDLSEAISQEVADLYSITAAEIEAKDARIKELEAELERERIRLAACGVIAMANTVDSAAKARDMLPEYWSASAQDCASAVDREMDYRSRLAVTERERDELRKALQKACIGLAHASEANPLYQKNYEACEKALMAIAQGKGKGE